MRPEAVTRRHRRTRRSSKRRATRNKVHQLGARERHDLRETRRGEPVRVRGPVSADAGRGLSDLDARIAAAKAEILARQETEVEAKRRDEEMVRSVKRVDEILESLGALAAAAGDDPVRRDDAAEKVDALEEYELLDDLQARPTAAGPVTESFEANEKREETAEARRRARLEKVGEEKKKKNALAGSGVAPGLTPKLGTVPLEQYVDSKGGMRDFQGYPGEEASE